LVFEVENESVESNVKFPFLTIIRDNELSDWYVWRDGKNKDGKTPPNNWVSLTGGSSWTYEPMRNQWYLAQYLEFQPDLNYRNPKVKETMFDIMRFWVSRIIEPPSNQVAPS
jgi:alpha-glucosidase